MSAERLTAQPINLIIDLVETHPVEVTPSELGALKLLLGPDSFEFMAERNPELRDALSSVAAAMRAAEASLVDFACDPNEPFFALGVRQA